MKPIVYGGAQRSPLMPEVPTLAELGYPDLGAYSWYGLFLPAGAPRAVIDRIHRDVHRIITEPDFRDKQIIGRSMEPVAGSSFPKEFAVFMLKESERNAKAVKLSGAKAE